MSSVLDGFWRPAAAAAIALLGGCGEWQPAASETSGTSALALDWVTPETELATDSDEQIAGEFGASVAIDGLVAVVGAQRSIVANAKDEPVLDAGTATLFAFKDGQWAEKRVLAAPLPFERGYFGAAVAISGGLLAVGARFSSPDEGQGPLKNAGMVYALHATEHEWNGALETISDPAQAAGRHFGTSVSVYGNRVLVGIPGDGSAPGEARVFAWTGSAWTTDGELKPPSSVTDPDDFGRAVALGQDVALVGAPDTNGAAGAVYVFVRSSGDWVRQNQVLAGDDASGTEEFGRSLALKSTRAIVGAIGASEYQGAAYLFLHDASADDWKQERKLVAKEPSSDAGFGSAVALGAGVAWVGAPTRRVAGDVYPYEQDTTQGSGTKWNERPPFELTEEYSDGSLGSALAASGKAVLIGAPNLSDYRGHAYLVQLADGSACDVDTDCKSSHCVEGVCCNDTCGDLCSSCLAENKASGADGVCGPVRAITNPRAAACPTEAKTSCGTTGVCDGAGACARYAKGVQCRDASCAEGQEHLSGTCDGNGTCQPSVVRDCAPAVCGDAACLKTCVKTADCKSGSYCAPNGKCQPQLGNASACEADDECLSGACADGVCCERACDGQCEACAERGSIGTCVAIEGAPRGTREACETGTDTCLARLCDGSDPDRCAAFADPSTVCHEASCKDGIETPELRCDGKGNCPIAELAECGNYACGERACLEDCRSDIDCVGGSYCDDNHCVAGARCSADNARAVNEVGDVAECFPYLCADGRCPNSCTDTSECAEGNLYCDTTSGTCETPTPAATADSEPRRSTGCSFAHGEPTDVAQWLVLLGALVTYVGRTHARRAPKTQKR